MSYEVTRQAVETALRNGVTGFDLIPENLPYEAKPGQTWIRYSIRPIDSKSGDVGGQMIRREMFLWLQIFIAEDHGTIEAMTIGDAVAAVFDEKVIVITNGTLTFRRASLGFVGPDNTGWDQWRDVIQFREETSAL